MNHLGNYNYNYNYNEPPWKLLNVDSSPILCNYINNIYAGLE